jgi:hypothetical protein
MRHSAKFITLLGGHCDRPLTAEAQQQTLDNRDPRAHSVGVWPMGDADRSMP